MRGITLICGRLGAIDWAAETAAGGNDWAAEPANPGAGWDVQQPVGWD